ncbi:MAG: PKD domain-containing protein [Cyclobacteriaceae bacterium]
MKINLLIYSIIAALIFVFACGEEEEPIPGSPPNVEAGTDVNATVGNSVQLSGTANDPDGDPLTISWTVTSAPAGSTASVNNASSLDATFVPDVPGNYTLRLTVDDGNYDPVSDELTIVAAEAVGEPPVVVIRDENNREISEDNDNNTVTIGTPYLLNASSTSDPDTEADELTFDWEITETPEGSSEASITSDPANSDEALLVPDQVGSYTVTLTVTDPEGNSDSESVEIVANAEPVVISRNIDTPTVLPNVFDNPDLPDYVVTANITVSETLTVRPGVKVMFEPNRGLNISGNSGALIAQGIADSLIVFTAQDSINGWSGITIFNNNALNELTYTDVSYGGNRNTTFGVEPANVGLEGGAQARLKVNNSTFSNSFSDGLFLENGSSFTEFANNAFIDNARHPISLGAMNVGSLDENSTYSGNGRNTVQIMESTLEMTDEQTWPALAGSVSYSAPQRLLISSGLRIMEGASFEFGSDGYVQINTDGYIIATGTETDSIRFTAQEEINGWGGLIFFSNDNKNALSYVSISYAGNRNATFGVQPSSIGLEGGAGSRLSITNSTISNSLGAYGLYAENGALLNDFSNNRFINNSGIAAAMSISSAGILDETSTFSGNGADAVEIFSSTLSENINLTAFTDGTPYRMSGNVNIEGSLTITPGTNIQLNQGVILEISSSGELVAVGEADRMINITATNPEDGWGGITIYSSKNINQMSYCNVSYGGNRSATFGIEPANIGLEGGSNGRLRLTNCVVDNSFGFGVFLESGGTVTDGDGTAITTQAGLEAAGNSFADNASGPSNL